MFHTKPPKPKRILKTVEELKATNAARQARYRAKKLRQLHPNANAKIVREFYKNRPEGYEVDHIRPLAKGGLHHENNLQYLTISENRTKGSIWLVETEGFEPIS
ncbi:MAG: hypothetical protein COA84_13550 [Robiginitomaculum sp.]|nr:MAG: hypothetical protein COA84_13550 [Robiginitomaculum sp.]